MEKVSMNKLEMARRAANGTGGGVSPAVIEEIQEKITILGSQNETQAQDITDIKAQLEELAGAYSTTEHKTGRKWIDGRDIYEKTIKYDSPFLNIDTNGTTVESSTGVGFPFNAHAIDPTYKSSTPLKISVESGNLKAYAFDAQFTAETVTFDYVKPTQE